MSEIIGGSEGDRADQSRPVQASDDDDLAEAMSPELSPLADRAGGGAEADPADVAEQQAEVPVTDDVLDDAEAAENHPE
jgi:hypothetical protein